MNFSNLFLITSFSLSCLNAVAADLKPVVMGTKEADVAIRANDVFSVKHLKLGGKTYKFVSLSSVLNGDVSSTTILLVGDEVGGEAGFEDAFVLSPAGEINSLKSARVVGKEVEVVLYQFTGKPVKKMLRYDAVAKTLKMRTVR